LTQDKGLNVIAFSLILSLIKKFNQN